MDTNPVSKYNMNRPYWYKGENAKPVCAKIAVIHYDFEKQKFEYEFEGTESADGKRPRIPEDAIHENLLEFYNAHLKPKDPSPDETQAIAPVKDSEPSKKKKSGLFSRGKSDGKKA